MNRGRFCRLRQNRYTSSGGRFTVMAVVKRRGYVRACRASWMPVVAEQHVRIDRPGFVWTADVAAGPFLRLAGRVSYREGTGRMRILAQSLIPVVDAQGPQTDQGTLLRFLAELVWYPSAALADWRPASPDP